MPAVTQGFRVTLPGARDIFHVVPDAARTPEERRRLRTQRFERMRDSPTPEVVKGAQAILTTIDDVQDALVTVSLATRFAVRALPAIAGPAKIIASAADVLNVGTMFTSRGLLGGSHKGSLFNYYSTQPATYSARLRSTLHTGAVKPTFGELLQVLQTSDQLAGVGLQLGGLIGLPIELLSLFATGGTLEVSPESLATLALAAPMLYAANPWIKLAALSGGLLLSLADPSETTPLRIPIPRLLPIDESTGSTLERPTSFVSSLAVLDSAQYIIEAGPLLDALDDDLTAEDHYTLTMARILALATVAPFFDSTKTDPFVREKFSFPIRRLSRPALDAPRSTGFQKLPLDTPHALPLRKSPLEIQAQDLPDALAEMNAPGIFGWIWKHTNNPLAAQAAALTGETAAAIATVLEGPAAYDGPHWSAEASAAARAVELNTPPSVSPR